MNNKKWGANNSPTLTNEPNRNGNTNMTYSELLLDVRWQKKRLEILSRDNWTCLRCERSDQTLHVHHNFYIKGKMPWEYENYVFETLCHKCHSKEHKPEPIISVIGELIKPNSIIQLLDEQLSSLQLKLRDKITDELQIEILKNIMFLKNKRKELVKNG